MTNDTIFLMRPISNQHHLVLPLWRNRQNPVSLSKSLVFPSHVILHLNQPHCHEKPKHCNEPAFPLARTSQWTSLCAFPNITMDQLVRMLVFVDFKHFWCLWCVLYLYKIVFNFLVVVWNWFRGRGMKFKCRKWRGSIIVGNTIWFNLVVGESIGSIRQPALLKDWHGE